MTGVETTSDVDVIEHLDFDTPLVCEVRLSRTDPATCGRPATWVARMRCCGFTVLMCDKDRAAAAANGERFSGWLRCGQCQARHRAYRDGVEFIPIGAKS